jgi:hypothetical protein
MSKKTITFQANFKAGAGEIIFTGIDGLPAGATLICDAAAPVTPQSFTANQSTGPQGIIVGGAAAPGATITLNVLDGTKQLATKDFKGPFAGVNISYVVAP